MVFIKRVNNSDVGDGTHWGGDHVDTLDKYFDDTDIEATTGKPAKINTKTEFRDNKLYIWNTANTAKYNIRPGSISGNVDLTLPTLASNGTLVATGGINDWGTALQTFRSSNIAFRNPANTASYIHVTSAITSNKNILWPLLTADDEVLLKNFTATIQNKIININQNTIKHETTNAEGDILVYDSTSAKYIRLARGTDGQILKVVSGDLAWANETASVPTEDLYSNLKSTSGGYKYGIWSGVSTTNGYGLFTNLASMGGSPLAYIDTTNGFSGRSWAMTSATAQAGIKTTELITMRKLNPDLEVCFQLDEGGDNTGSRVYIGFWSDISEIFTNDIELDADNGFMLVKSSTETGFRIGSNDGSGTGNYTSSILTTDSNVHTIRLFADETNSRWGYQLDGGTISYVSTAGSIPIATTQLYVVINASQEDTTPRNFRIFWAKLKMKERA